MVTKELATIEPELAIDPTYKSPVEPEHVLKLLGLEKYFLSGFTRRRIPAVRGISFMVPRGKIFALLGHNGAGKTTTFNCILDLVHPTAGQIEIFGNDHRNTNARTRVGFLPEQPYFYEHLSGRELLHFYCDLFEIPKDRQKKLVTEILGRVQMDQYSDRTIRKYSKGMRQRLGIAQALLNDPDLLILDEPMSGLDPLGRRQVRELIQELKAQGTTILLSSHIVSDVEALADTVVILRDGYLKQTCALEELHNGSSYEVRLSQMPVGERATRLLARCALTALNPDVGPVTIGVPDTESLREILAVCHEEDITVLTVETNRTDLEAIFVASQTEMEKQTC
jgi:ABC-2 type transport system ATP-binding protein